MNFSRTILQLKNRASGRGGRVRILAFSIAALLVLLACAWVLIRLFVPPTLVIAGDSIAALWPTSLAPVALTKTAGVAGQTSAQLLARFEHDALSKKPKYVLIMVGTNDLANGLTQQGLGAPCETLPLIKNMRQMIERANARGLTAMIGSVLPVSDEKVLSDGRRIEQIKHRPPLWIAKINTCYAALAQMSGVVFLDFGIVLKNPQGNLDAQLTDDGLHPNAAGYKRMRAQLRRTIRAKVDVVK